MGERDWMRTLDEVDQAIGGCLSALERYEAKFVELLREQAVVAGPHFERSLPDVSPDEGWNDRLLAAKTGADEAPRRRHLTDHALTALSFVFNCRPSEILRRTLGVIHFLPHRGPQLLRVLGAAPF